MKNIIYFSLTVVLMLLKVVLFIVHSAMTVIVLLPLAIVSLMVTAFNVDFWDENWIPLIDYLDDHGVMPNFNNK